MDQFQGVERWFNIVYRPTRSPCLVCGLVGSRIRLSFAHSIVHAIVYWVIVESFSHVLPSCSSFFQQYGAWNVHMKVVDILIV